MKLGKKDYRHDDRTVTMGRFLAPIRVPTSYDFDKGRVNFPSNVWGNDEYGDCVLAGRANSQLRLERVEQRRTVPLTADDVISEYKKLTGCQSPGDANDEGLVVLDAMRQWRNEGWVIGGRTYQIAAYGELEPQDFNKLRAAVYGLHGVHFGLALPVAAQHMNDYWDYQGQSGEEWQPGSWGGHLVYGKAYRAADEFRVITWGREISMTGSFIRKYCDEAWAVVDNLDLWRHSHTLDVQALTAELHEISANVDE